MAFFPPTMNSCCPNAVIGFSIKSFSIQFHAAKDIKAGEEVFCSYICLEQSAKEREEKLSPYGFNVNVERASPPTAALIRPARPPERE